MKTMLKLIAAALLLCVAGCDSASAPTPKAGTVTAMDGGISRIRTPPGMPDAFAVPVDFDGCQQYAFSVNGGSVIVHRDGSCTNCWDRIARILNRRLEERDMVEVVLTNRVMVPKGP